LNVERMSMEGACDMLRRVMHEVDFQPTPESIAQVENDYIATQALASLVLDPKTLQLELSAGMSDGRLHLVGPYLSEADMKTVLSIVRSVPGVGDVQYEPGYAPAFGRT